VRKVTTGPADATNTTIVSGLAVGENVVIDGADRLRDGAKVNVRNAAAQGPAAAAAPGQEQRQHRRQTRGDAGAPAPAARPAP
jgi:multidrug efflux system membrane fusion protein